MNRFVLVVLIIGLFGCKQARNKPDISGGSVALQVQHYEQDFFTIDTLALDRSLKVLENKYGGFHTDFLYNILGTTKSQAPVDIRSFLRSYHSLYTDITKIKEPLKNAETQAYQGMRYMHYYFPSYKLPARLISFIGPINSYGCIITTDAVAVGLQLFLGSNHPIYTSEQGQSLYPSFISRKFEPAYIPVAVMNALIDDLYPDKSLGKPLIEQMIETGKRVYLLDAFLPDLPDSVKTGYTQSQLETAFKSERTIWSFFIQNDLLFKSDPELTRDYINDGPYTAALGAESPGKIGLFVGWQIVKKWMGKNPKVTLKMLMEKDASAIFNESGYKPN